MVSREEKNVLIHLLWMELEIMWDCGRSCEILVRTNISLTLTHHATSGILVRFWRAICNKNRPHRVREYPNNNSVGTNTAYSNRTGVDTHTEVLSLFYHRSGIIFVALVAKPRVATKYHFNEKPHTIADDMVSHHVITLVFVLLATRSIQNTVPSLYVVCLLC